MAVLVRAHIQGFWDNTRRRVGDEFLVPDDFAKKSRWWHVASELPPEERARAAAVVSPGNANAHHVPGSTAADRAKRPASSAESDAKPIGQAKKPTGTGDQKVI